MQVSEIGEFGLIARIAKLIRDKGGPAGQASQRLLVGIGDDAAAWWNVPGIELATTDIMVEGVHFNLAYTGWKDLGWKALAANLSDIAAMGGLPSYALVSLVLPGATLVSNVTAMYSSMLELAGKFELALVGGNIAGGENTVINITVIGRARGKSLLTRSAARPGDAVAVTGHPGLSAAGLNMLMKKLRAGSAAVAVFRRAHLRPVPRIEEAGALVRAGIRCCTDTSDGLIADLSHICEASRVGATVRQKLLPLHPFMREFFPGRSAEMALTGGEDYELLFTGERGRIEKLRDRLGCPVTIIGSITAGHPGEVKVLDAHNKPVRVSQHGWDHYGK